MPNKVIALIYTHSGDGVYHTEATNETKALLRKVNKALTERYGHRVGTCWGDGRGKDSQGNTMLGYALCMETPPEKVKWLLETFWRNDGIAFQEQIPGIGYISKSVGRAPMYELDISKGDAGVAAFLLAQFSMNWTSPPPAKVTAKSTGETKEGRKTTPAVDADDPFLAMDIDDLRSLCTEADVEFSEADSPVMLRNLYLQAIAQ